MPDSDKKGDADDIDEKFELIDTEAVFSDMYVKDMKKQNRIQEILKSRELKGLMAEAEKTGKSIPLLKSVVPETETPVPFFQILRKTFKVFRSDPEYSSKEAYVAYVAYLRSAYKFLMVPLEKPPNLIVRIFFREISNQWKPSPEDSRELLEKFFLETSLIRQLSEEEWGEVIDSDDPEVVLNRLLYGIEFKKEFEGFLHKIPWIVSRDRYGAPALDLMFWNPPGTEIPQKPVGVDDEFIDDLIDGVKQRQSYARIEVNDKFVELKSRKQVEKRLKVDERVLIDSYVGVSKIERDFVLHKRLILWSNPGYERYEKESRMGKIKTSKPKPYLAMLQEKATQLEIPFVAHEHITKVEQRPDFDPDED